MRVLADTSVWVDYLRAGVRGESTALGDLLASGGVVVCGPVVAELLAGVAPDRQEELWHLFGGLPWSEIGRQEWRRVGELAAALRSAGTAVAMTDVQIAVAAMADGARLWSRDTDFDRMAEAAGDLVRFTP